jgi:hypothetical protein
MKDHYWAFLNKREKIFWKGYSSENRNNAIHYIEQSIIKYGYITDYHMFSDLEINFTIEIEESKINDLYTELGKRITMSESDPNISGTPQLHTIFLNVTFSNSTGDLRHTIPSVPG